ncbi:hypothetical protein EON83_28900 [bacterium]|nr:MAG: hypothetical protein EON83_28900 [bacterium]
MTRISLRLDVEEWTQELIAVWKPTRILEVSNRGTLGLLFIAQIHPSLILHLRVQWNGIDRCTVWQKHRYVSWDRSTGFCPELKSSPVLDETEEWERQVGALIRRNCFRMGCDVGATEEEKRQWRDGLAASP